MRILHSIEKMKSWGGMKEGGPFIHAWCSPRHWRSPKKWRIKLVCMPITRGHCGSGRLYRGALCRGVWPRARRMLRFDSLKPQNNNHAVSHLHHYNYHYNTTMTEHYERIVETTIHRPVNDYSCCSVSPSFC